MDLVQEALLGLVQQALLGLVQQALMGLVLNNRFCWKLVQKRGCFRNREEFFGFLKYKFKYDQHGARLKIKSIPNFG